MALYRRLSRFVVDTFRRYNSNTRIYCVDRNRVSLIPRNRKLITRGFLGSVFATSVYFWNLETIPYTKRTHFVAVPTYLEKEVAQFLIKFKAEEYEWKTLPSHHPQSIRVTKIGHDIIGALLKEVKKEEEDNQQIACLDEFKWEVIVVDDPDTVNAVYTPGGKIVVYTGLLDYFKTDAEIAAIIGHEVGHAAARHGAETVSEFLWLMLLMLFMPGFIEKMLDLYMWRPVVRRQEIEADYIGLLLMASAGYDPRVAVEVCEKFDQREYTLALDDEYYLSEKKRAQLLSEPKVMEEALSLYRKALEEGEEEAEGEEALSLYREELKEKEKEKEKDKKKKKAEGEGEGNHPMSFLPF